MQSIAYISASDGTANASLATVTTIRSALATEILVNTVAGYPAKFYATMGTPHSFTDPVTGETIQIISEATAVDFAGHINSGKIEIDAIAPGYVDGGSKVGDIVVIKPSTEWSNNIHNILAAAHNDDGTIKNGAITTNAQFVTALDPVQRQVDDKFNHIVSGCVWTADAAGSTRLASMTSGVVYIAGKRLTVAAVVSRTFTASKDTYVDFQDNGDGTAKIVYTEVTNNAVSPAIPNSLADATNVRNAIIVTGASNIAASTSVNQGQETALLPTGGGGTYFLMVTDGIGNLICPRDPNRKVLGYRQQTNNQTTSSTTSVQLVGETCQVIVPAGRKVKVTIGSAFLYNSTAGNRGNMSAWEGAVASGIELTEAHGYAANSSSAENGFAQRIYTPTTSGLLTYNAGFSVSASGAATVEAYSYNPAYILIELV